RLPHPAAARVDAPQPCQRIGFQGLETLAARNLHGRLRGLPRLWHPAHLLEYPGESPQREDLKHRANFAIVPEGLRRQLHSTLELPEHPVIDRQVSEHRVLIYPVPKSTQNLDGFSFFLNSFLDATRTTEQPSHVGYRTGFGVAISRLVRDRARFIAARAGLLDIPELILKLLHVQQALGLLHPVSSLMPECSLLVDNQDSLASALLGLCLLLLRGFIVESLGLQALLVQGFCCPQLLEHDGVTQVDPAAGRDNRDPIRARRLGDPKKGELMRLIQRLLVGADQLQTELYVAVGGPDPQKRSRFQTERVGRSFVGCDLVLNELAEGESLSSRNSRLRGLHPISTKCFRSEDQRDDKPARDHGRTDLAGASNNWHRPQW